MTRAGWGIMGAALTVMLSAIRHNRPVTSCHATPSRMTEKPSHVRQSIYLRP